MDTLAYLYNISQGCDYKQEMNMVIVLKVTLSKWVLVYRDRTVSMDIFTTNRPRTVQMAFTPGIRNRTVQMVIPEGYMNRTVVHQIILKPGLRLSKNKYTKGEQE